MARTTRQGAPVELKYDITHIYRSVSEFEKDAAALKHDVDTLESMAGGVVQDADNLLSALQLMESIQYRLDSVEQYANVHTMADATDGFGHGLAAQFASLENPFKAASALIVDEIVQAGEARLRDFMATHPHLVSYRTHLDKLLGDAKHRLSPQGEQILAALSPSLYAPTQLYGLITNADLVCDGITDGDGSEIEVSIANYMFHLSQVPDRSIRRKAYESMMSGLAKHHITLASNYLNHIQTQVTLARLRGYASAKEMFLAKDGIPTEFYDKALDIIMDEAKQVARRYVALQKRVRGFDKVRMYDLTGPLVTSDINLTYEQGQELIETALRPLGDEYHEYLHAAFTQRRIDLADNFGKFPIPVTLTCYGAPTYILSSWTGHLSDAIVLGHELGHLVHTDFTRRQNRFDANYSMLLAETASTTNEWLMFHHLRQTGNADLTQRAARHLIEFDFVALIGMLFVVEKMQAELYARVEAGEPVAPTEVSSTLAKYFQEFYGEEFELTEWDGLNWACWPQPIYATLYPYCYAAAFCMSGEIAEAILQEGQPVIDRYLRFLESGGCVSAPETFAIAGVDMLSEDTLRNGIRRFGAVLEELELAFRE